ncbi:MAG TPA: rhomboid family intramembrane serine protease [Solirubrobacteraceae bacterium]|nr:rhomboid family intramembrane serine protease [Solirubrobacteraceae bacterium]
MIPIKDNIPTDRFPFVTVALIVTNIVVYILAIRHGGSFFGGPDTQETVTYGAIPYALTHPGDHCGLAQTVNGAVVACQGQPGVVGTPTDYIPTWQTVFTSMFMHGSFLHIAGNMLFLWIFGNTIEDSMGPVRFIVFYLLAGIAALALQVAIAPNATAPTIGASGAIAGVLGGYILLYPRARVLTLVIIILFFTVIELPATVLLGLWFVIQALYGAVSLTDPTGAAGGVAYFAHIGGFAFGLAAIKLFATGRKQVPPRFPVS